MNLKRFNWPIWIGLFVSIFAFLSYYTIFIWFPPTRNFPWANLLLFVGSVAFLLLGLRRAFAKGRPIPKIVASIVTTLGVLVFALFLFTFFIFAKWLPASQGAPHVGQKAPDFTLSDTHNKQVALSALLSTPIEGKAPKGVLLIFYRGYW